MKYRGVNYQPVSTNLELVASDIVACYRGQKYWQKVVKHLPEKQSQTSLGYRGANYTLGVASTLLEDLVAA